MPLPVTIHDQEPPKGEIIRYNGMTEMYGSTTGFAVSAFGIAPNNISCTQLAAGQVPDSSSNWGQGALNTAKMFFAWEYGVGNTSTDFGPNSVESQQMMSAYGLAANVNSFLNGGPSSGFQNFGLGGLLSSGLNPTAQFVGSYGWNMSLSGGYLNIL